MKVNLIGAYGVEGMHTHLAEILNKYGLIRVDDFVDESIEADVNSINYEDYDVNMVMGLWKLCPDLIARSRFTVAFCCGSDVWRDWHSQLKSAGICELLKKCGLVLYGSPLMKYVTGVCGTFWHMPFDDLLFCIQPSMRLAKPDRDVLFYCPNPVTYMLDVVLDYVNRHPEQKCTLLGGAYQNLVMEEPPENLLLLGHVPYHDMPLMYLRHREYRLYLNHPATPYSAMTCEALRMGIRAFRDCVEETWIPDYLFPEVAVPSLLKLFGEAKR